MNPEHWCISFVSNDVEWAWDCWCYFCRVDALRKIFKNYKKRDDTTYRLFSLISIALLQLHFQADGSSLNDVSAVLRHNHAL